MKLIDILQELLKEEDSNEVFFILNPSKIFEALLDEFFESSPSMQKLLSRGAAPQDLSLAMDSLAGLTMSNGDVDATLGKLNVSKSELNAAKRDMESFASKFKIDLPAISNVFKAAYAAFDSGNDDLLYKLSPQEIDTYLKYYTSDAVNASTKIRSSENYSEFINVLKDLKKK